MSHYLDLVDYRRAVAGLYGDLRNSDLEPSEACRQFRRNRDRLFRDHPQSALSIEQQARFTGLRYFDYDPAYRFLIAVEDQVERQVFEIELGEDGLLRIERFGKIHLDLGGRECALSLFWIMGYGGGLFLPFRDQTSGSETYGGGRYLLDSIKHADLGQIGDRLVIDFNYAYNPSCAYNSRWVCPLAPRENWLPVPIRAGECDFG